MCLIRNEPGADIVKDVLPESCISAVNLAEVVAKMDELGMAPPLIAEVLEPLQLETIAFDREQAFGSGLLRQATRGVGLSLGDRACLSLAIKLDAEALTTDQAWSKLNTPAKIRLIR